MTGCNHPPVCQPEAVMFISSVYNFLIHVFAIFDLLRHAVLQTLPGKSQHPVSVSFNAGSVTRNVFNDIK